MQEIYEYNSVKKSSRFTPEAFSVLYKLKTTI